MTAAINFDFLRAIQSAAPGDSRSAIAAAGGVGEKNFAKAAKAHQGNGTLNPEDPLKLTPKGQALLAAAEGDAPPAPDSAAAAVPLSAIVPCPLNPRKTFDEASIDELAQSIKAQGLLQNLVVRPVEQGAGAGSPERDPSHSEAERGSNKTYELIAGERRFRALTKLASAGDLPADHPVSVKIQPMSDVEVLTAAIVENRQREDVLPIEEARAFADLQAAMVSDGEETALSAKIAKATGVSARWVQDRIKMARDLCPEVQAAMAVPGSPVGPAYARILSRVSHNMQRQALSRIIAGQTDEWGGFKSEVDLKRWIGQESYPVDHIKFDLENYTARGGKISASEDDEGVNRLTDKDIAEDLQIEAVLAEIRDAHGDGLTVRRAQWVSDYDFPKAPKTAPVNQVFAVYSIRRSDLQAEWRYPVITRQNLEAMGKKAGKGAGVIAEIPRRAWVAGGKVRTEVVRGIVASDMHFAMALTVVSLMEQDLSARGHRMLHLRRERPTGDSKAEDDIAPCLDYEYLARLEGFSDDGTCVTDRGAAFEALAGLPPHSLEELFQQFIADQCIDIPADAAFSASWGGPGASPEAIAIANGHAKHPAHDRAGRAADADWMNQYPGSVLEAIAVEAGEPSRRQRDGQAKSKKKKDRAAQVAKFRDPGWVPIEARFLSKDAAKSLANAALTAKEAPDAP